METTFNWYGIVLLATFSAGAWFAVAGLAGIVAARRAQLWVAGLVGAFLLASLVYFVGF